MYSSVVGRPVKLQYPLVCSYQFTLESGRVVSRQVGVCWNRAELVRVTSLFNSMKHWGSYWCHWKEIKLVRQTLLGYNAPKGDAHENGVGDAYKSGCMDY